MSKENLELVRRLQPSGLDLVEGFSVVADQLVSGAEVGLFTDDFEVAFIAGGSRLPTAVISPAGQNPRGPEGLTAMWREWLTPWRSYRVDVEEFIDAGDAIVVFVRVEARTERDDVLLEHSPAAIWRIREGKIAAIHFYLEREEALEAAGRVEQDARDGSS